jgi:putative oxygen-independent coproporphyrinogen III oxidase
MAGAEPLALYIHWPFCVSKCPYCDFNSHVRESVDEARWTRALLADLDHAAELAPDRELVSLFFGGGTPSLMPPAAVAALIARARRHWPAAENLEITLEANPNSADRERFRAYRSAGVNRLSLGVQALDGEALALLGRRHDKSEAITALEAAREIFPRFSFDLIYARPGQSGDAWRRELGEALLLAADHLSLYQLTIEPGTRFATLASRGALSLPDEETAAQLYELTQEVLGAAGLPAYEVSNHARPGAECRHNLAYWRYEDYLGIGPGAEGRVGRDGGKFATRQARSPERWLSAVETAGTGLDETLLLSREAEIEERLMMGLRLAEGVSRAAVERTAGCSLEALFGSSLPPLVEGGFLSLDRERLAATGAGRQRLNAVLAALFA